MANDSAAPTRQRCKEPRDFMGHPLPRGPAPEHRLLPQSRCLQSLRWADGPTDSRRRADTMGITVTPAAPKSNRRAAPPVTELIAAAYLARGWSVIPVMARGKTPLVEW